MADRKRAKTVGELFRNKLRGYDSGYSFDFVMKSINRFDQLSFPIREDQVLETMAQCFWDMVGEKFPFDLYKKYIQKGRKAFIQEGYDSFFKFSDYSLHNVFDAVFRLTKIAMIENMLSIESYDEIQDFEINLIEKDNRAMIYGSINGVRYHFDSIKQLNSYSSSYWITIINEKIVMYEGIGSFFISEDPGYYQEEVRLRIDHPLIKRIANFIYENDLYDKDDYEEVSIMDIINSDKRRGKRNSYKDIKKDYYSSGWFKR